MTELQVVKDEPVTEIVQDIRTKGAEKVNELVRKIAQNAIQAGGELKKIRDTFPRIGAGQQRPGWYQWIEENLHIKSGHVGALIRIHDKFSGEKILLPYRVMESLLPKDVPPEAVEQVTMKIEGGEKVTAEQAKEIAEAWKERKKEAETFDPESLPSAAEARRLARETGQAVLAKDGKWYFGATIEEEQAIEARRSVVYSVRDAVQTLANMQMTPREFLDYALPHQLWPAEEAHWVGKAAEWLNDLAREWRS